MATAFQVVTPPAFERSARRAIRRNPGLAALLEELVGILETDPYNRTGQYDIRKLTDIKPGDGQWRIRSGDYRLRYDIFGREVVLYAFRHRREVYWLRYPGDGEIGCVLEVFSAIGESIRVVVVPESVIEPLRADEVIAVRSIA